jgi:lipopolysaccharide export LptBFGC system permease protein LptF
MPWTVMFLRFLLPDLATVSHRSQRIVAAATALMFALLALNIAHTQFGLGGGLDKVLNAWGQNLVLACACAVVAVRLRTGGAPGCTPLLAAMVCGPSATCGGDSSSTT